MKNDKITIYMMPWGIKVFCTIVFGFAILCCSLPFMLMPDIKLEWQAILVVIMLGIFFAYAIFVSFFSRIVFDGERGVLKLCDFWVRTIPLQDIKVVERDNYIYNGRYGPHCWIHIERISGKKGSIALSIPLFFGRKSWLEHIDQEITDLNKRIDDWYREYRKKNKKR